MNTWIHAQKVFEEFKLKCLSNYQDLYVQSETLLLADAFENLDTSVLKYMNWVKRYQESTAHFLSAPRWAW